MNISNERAKEILDNAPEGAQYYSERMGRYYKVGSYSWYDFINSGWSWRESPVVEGSGPYTHVTSLSDLRAQLDQEVEWIEGDICNIDEYDGEWVYGCDVPMTESCIVFRLVSSSHMIIPKCRLKKPETEAEKEARLREEAVSEMASTPKPCGHAIYNICADLYDAGYRKVEVK